MAQTSSTTPLIATPVVDIKIRKNADFIFTVSIKNNGQPVNITGWSAILRIQGYGTNNRTHHPIDASTANGLCTNLGVLGKFRFKVPSTETAKIPWLDGEYNVLYKDLDGNSPEILCGLVTALGAIAPPPQK